MTMVKSGGFRGSRQFKSAWFKRRGSFRWRGSGGGGSYKRPPEPNPIKYKVPPRFGRGETLAKMGGDIYLKPMRSELLSRAGVEASPTALKSKTNAAYENAEYERRARVAFLRPNKCSV